MIHRRGCWVVLVGEGERDDNIDGYRVLMDGVCYWVHRPILIILQ